MNDGAGGDAVPNKRAKMELATDHTASQSETTSSCDNTAELTQLREKLRRFESDERIQNLSNEIIEFWMGNRSNIGVKYKENWFAAPGSPRQQAIDQEVKEKYASLLDKVSNQTLEIAWTRTDRRIASLILVLDQFSRHIFRYKERVKSIDADAKQRGIRACTSKALELSKRLFANGAQHRLETPLFVFALMPFRHTPTVQHLEFVMEQIGERKRQLGFESAAGGDKSTLAGILCKFESATKQRLLHLSYEAKNCASNNISAATADSGGSDNSHEQNHGTMSLDPRFAAVLERMPEEKDESSLIRHRVFRECASFFGFDGVVGALRRSAPRADPSNMSWSKKRKLEKKRRKQQRKEADAAKLRLPNSSKTESGDGSVPASRETSSPTDGGGERQSKSASSSEVNALSTQGTAPTKTVEGGADAPFQSTPRQIIISLSGGVDSMVICKCLTVLRSAAAKHGNANVPEIVAVHIDYGNRQESPVEAEFLEKWCKSLDITFRLRRITEAKRGGGQVSRTEYEQLTRDIRFNAYVDGVPVIVHAV